MLSLVWNVFSEKKPNPAGMGTGEDFVDNKGGS
jgi:hypothetical protein